MFRCEWDVLDLGDRSADGVYEELRVLIVDDSKLARMAMARLLGGLRPDWTRVEATNADEALILAQQGDFDVALLDFNMPGRDGLALAGELIALRPGLAIALVSANLQTEITRRAKEIGVMFLPKPLSQESIESFVDFADNRAT
jgi:CheY-like chemotaxis protein